MANDTMIEKLQQETVSAEEIMDYKNPELSVDRRVSDLLSRMTIEEKVAQMLCIWTEKKNVLFNKKGDLDVNVLGEHLNNGIGQIARLSDTNGGLGPVEMAELANKIQKFFIEETRLGIPVIFHEECLHGLAGKDATSYPQPIGLAATFNPQLIEDIYSAVAEDTRARGAHQALTPVVDVARDPRWGRVEETYGEDPYLVTQMGLAAVKGFQGDATYSNKKKIFATLKHFAAHGQPESGTNCAPVNVSERLLRDTFLSPFKEAIQKGKVASVMASYNEIDGLPSHANTWLLRTVLRDEWGFNGFIISDYYAITELNVRPDAISHSVAKDKKDAARLAVEAGVNIESPDPDCYPNLTHLVRSGEVSESKIDELVSVLLDYKFRMGLFDDPYVDPQAIQNDKKLESDRRIALRAAHETITLLKNENDLLPLTVGKQKTIGVIGPNADRSLLGGYSGTPKFYSSVLQGIKEKVGKNARVLYSEGCKITVGGSWNEDAVVFPSPEDDARLIKEAVEVAKKSDIVILAIGENEQTSREAWSKVHMGDRADIDLIGAQNDLVKAVLTAGKPVVALLFNGRPNAFGFVNDHIPAIVECWYLGQETGVAVADVLFGDYNPAGKLPISIPRSSGHVPCYYNYKPSARRGYLKDDVSAMYPFGFGMSYTSFSISAPVLAQTSIHTNESTKVSVEVKNTGKRSGDCVLQMYIRDVVSSVTRPVKELKGFKKINLKPGEKRTVDITITPASLAFTTVNKTLEVEPGDFEIFIGSSSRDEDLRSTTLTVL